MSILDFLLKLIAYIAPYFFIPWTFKWAGGVFASLAGMVNDRGKGIFDRNRNYRANARKNQMQRTMEGKRKSWGVGELMRRAKFADQGGLAFGGRGRAQYQAVKGSFYQQAANKMVEQDGSRSGGDDDLTAMIARRSATTKSVQRDYSALLQKRDGLSKEEADRRATEAVGAFQGNFGAVIGSDTARIAAYKAWMASNTSANTEDYDLEIARTSAELINDGLMTTVDAAATVKSNKMRGERSGAGFSTWMATLNEAAQNERKGAPGPIISDKTREYLRQDPVSGMDIGQLMGGRHETVKLLAPTIYKNLSDAVAGNEDKNGAILGFAHDGTAEGKERARNSAIQKSLAQIAAVQNIAGQVSQLKNDHNIRAMNEATQNDRLRLPGMDYDVSPAEALKIMREGQYDVYDKDHRPVMEDVIGSDQNGRAVVIGQRQKTERIDNSEYLARQREYGSGASADAAAAAGRPPDQQPGHLPGA